MFGFKKNFGFGFMRLPMIDKKVDMETTMKMVDAFMSAGFEYFDTAHVYLGGESERALKACLTSRYPRDAYYLTNKLSNSNFQSEADIRPLFQSQLDACGVDYFDFYLMHAQEKKLFEKYKACRAYETAFELKAEGKIRHVGISFHDSADVLEQILLEYPQLEAVQLQFNYADYDDPAVQSQKCYEVCRKHNKPVIVMEPVKGGSLVNLPVAAKAVLDPLGGSYASYALRFAAGFEGIEMVLSGMGSMEMVRDNIASMTDFKPLNAEEMAAIEKVRTILKSQDQIPCTACRYCVDGCPMAIPIPDLFACLNAKKQWDSWNASYYYNIHTANAGKASDCVRCGLCEDSCPQHLPIRELLETVASTFEK